MKKVRTLTACLVVVALTAALVVLASCGQQSQASSSSSSSSLALQANEQTYTPPSQPFYVLLVGDDARKDTVEITKPDYADGLGRSDTIMLARIDPATFKISLVTIPRDTEDSVDGNTMKINERYHGGGINSLLEGVENLTGVRPQYYIIANFVTFEKIVDTLQGVDVDVRVALSMQDIVGGDQIEIGTGVQTLNGPEALVFARERKKYNSMNPVGGEPIRQTNDRLLVQTMITKILANPETAEDVSGAMFSLLQSNWDAQDLKGLVKLFADNASKVNFISGTGPYEGYTNATAGWLATRDEATWAEVIKVVNEGGDPNTVIEAPSLYE